jgi:hypothetical protein
VLMLTERTLIAAVRAGNSSINCFGVFHRSN